MGAMGSSSLADMSFEEGMRAPNSVLEEAAKAPMAIERKAIVSNQDQVRKEGRFNSCVASSSLRHYPSTLPCLRHIYMQWLFWPLCPLFVLCLHQLWPQKREGWRVVSGRDRDRGWS